DYTVDPAPFRDPLDLRWLDAFDSVYAGDPRAADLPEFDFWRSMDVYSDHTVRRFAANGVPLRRIDSTSFMVGNTGTDYQRGTSAWKGMLLLEMARGGWVNTLHGNLELLSDSDARWFARAQRLYAPLQQAGATTLFGGVPGKGSGQARWRSSASAATRTGSTISASSPISASRGRSRRSRRASCRRRRATQSRLWSCRPLRAICAS